MHLNSGGDFHMTPDAVKQCKPPRWFSPRGAVFWILTPAVVIAATLAVLMFWPGLAYDWRSSDGNIGLVRGPLSEIDPGARGDGFWVHAKWCELAKFWNPDRALAPGPSRIVMDSHAMTLSLGEYVFMFSWGTPP